MNIKQFTRLLSGVLLAGCLTGCASPAEVRNSGAALTAYASETTNVSLALSSENGEQAGTDFFNKDGTVDVCAVRDRSRLVRFSDGSYDPSGILTGVEAFSAEEFAARDIEALQNPVQITASAGDGSLTEEELNAIAEEYAPFGVAYDFGANQWYWNGEAVCYLRDVLTSNGERLTGGGFHGTIRTLSSRGGTIRIETIRDFTRPDSLGYGTLTGIQILAE